MMQIIVGFVRCNGTSSKNNYIEIKWTNLFPMLQYREVSQIRICPSVKGLESCTVGCMVVVVQTKIERFNIGYVYVGAHLRIFCFKVKIRK